MGNFFKIFGALIIGGHFLRGCAMGVGPYNMPLWPLLPFDPVGVEALLAGLGAVSIGASIHGEKL
jgi:hypothetical protein